MANNWREAVEGALKEIIETARHQQEPCFSEQAAPPRKDEQSIPVSDNKKEAERAHGHASIDPVESSALPESGLPKLPAPNSKSKEEPSTASASATGHPLPLGETSTPKLTVQVNKIQQSEHASILQQNLSFQIPTDGYSFSTTRFADAFLPDGSYSWKKVEEHINANASGKAIPSESAVRANPFANIVYIRTGEDMQSLEQQNDNPSAGQRAGCKAPFCEVDEEVVKHLVKGVLYRMKPKGNPVSISAPSGCCHPDHFTDDKVSLQKWTSFALRLSYNAIFTGYTARAAMHPYMQAYFPNGRLVLLCLRSDAMMVNVLATHGQLVRTSIL